MTFWSSQSKVTVTGKVEKSVSCLCQNLSGFNLPNVLKSVTRLLSGRVNQKNKNVVVLEQRKDRQTRAIALHAIRTSS